MNIGFFKLGLQNAIVKTIFQGMYDSFFNALKNQGHRISLLFDYQFNGIEALVIPVGEGQEKDGAKAMAKFDGPVILYATPAYNWFRKSFLSRWKHKILFVYSTDASNYSDKRYAELGISHYHLPFASDESVFKPLNMPKTVDILFIANAWSGIGRHRYIEPLIERSRLNGWKLLLFGGGWEKYGYPQQFVAHGEMLNLIYNSSTININLFNDEQKRGKEKCLDANNRLFDLAIAGCFQICNASEITNNYFNDQEIVSCKNPEEWLDSIEYYLHNVGERETISTRCLEKARRHHTWNVRALEFDRILSSHLKVSSPAIPKIGFTSVQREWDQLVPSMYKLKVKGKKVVKKLWK